MLTLRRPFDQFAQFDRVFNGFHTHGACKQSFAPAVDIEEHKENFLLTADLPGVSEDDIELKVHDGVLELNGSRQQSTAEERERGLFRERRFGSFSRRFRLGDGVNTEAIEARFKNGVLNVTLPKKEELKPKQIEVKIN